MDLGVIRPFYADWEAYNRHIVEVVGEMTGGQLAVQPARTRWPVWATVGYMAGVRVFWLCHMPGEPGIETTPFGDPTLDGSWEDDLDHPRGADELVDALQSTWSLIAGCLDRWTPEMLDETIVTKSRPSFSRQSILLRLLSHDPYHAGELSQTLGIAGLPQIDLWPPEDHSSSSSRRRIKLAVSATFPASLMAWSYAARNSCLRPIRRRRSARVAW